MAWNRNPNVEWIFNNSPDPWSSTATEAVWERYNDIDSDILEKAFQNKQKTVSLGNYYVSLVPNKMVQVHKLDEYRQRPIRRREGTPVSRIAQRQDRFNFTDKLGSKTFGNTGVCMSPFVEEWIRRNPNYKFKEETIEQLASGLEQEGVAIGEADAAKFIALEIRQHKHEERSKMIEYCVRLYTADTWIYRLVNSTLRENDMSKVDTLGPFCCFIRNFLHASQKEHEDEEMVVYRGMELEPKDIQVYKDCVGEVHSWFAFSSTTKSRAVAENFAVNVLFEIHFDGFSASHYPGRDISILSNYPKEEEILLQPGADFRIDEVKEQKIGGRKLTIIRLALM
ncbi:unnamed protein product [Adineta ricciae]|uniref:WWE domain-containing protein n=1 Tax=Adineta ricciae TaxID=249248 RepID=A0A814XMU4_ADIRI|nr:unnamed protein product [Adineta ricciae]CAF1374770.1 unnamed protein product [Adineta ricciae]